MDYYVQNPRMLEGQPKRTIGDYVEQNGILVPRRFDTLAEARRSHKAILLRAEHPQDYDGASGLLDSFPLSYGTSHQAESNRKDIKFSPRGMTSVEDIKDAYFGYQEDYTGTALYRQYCRFLNLEEEEFKKQVSFSIWELLGGFNRTVIADSAIPNRHHVMTFYHGKGKSLYNYAITENGKLSQEFVTPLPEDLRNNLENLIGQYETVRHLDRFDQNHCPIMEFQTHNGRNYFLQYHRARDSSPSEFTLDRALEEGELEALFVRGATSKEGMDCKVTVYYARSLTWNLDPENEDGSFDLHYNQVFPELRLRKRKVQIINSEELNWDLMKFVVKHLQTSKLFKSQVSIIQDIDKLIPEESIKEYIQRTRSGKNSYIDLHIVSDGRRAFVKRI